MLEPNTKMAKFVQYNLKKINVNNNVNSNKRNTTENNKIQF